MPQCKYIWGEVRAKTVKIRALRSYKDKKLNKQIDVGDIYEVTKSRLAEIQKAEAERGYKLVEVIEE